MHLLDAGGSLANGGSYAFDASATNIAHREDPRSGWSRRIPVAASCSTASDRGAEAADRVREDEGFLVQGNAAGKPVGARHGPGHQRKRA